ncbi:hypothetical protein T265_01813 [Opisthorchis viverrini]|uniref:Uncharacterized protein n=1 Tax=Opisthorchis viverrini TaxID=6198 RepID=A0A075A8I2_OPIVI|nr:hypothetical protein T265_01813 [Opisthorchis viverrini]KER32035.1 hypothetical protein T265_01813 [Opisthorchis viverrini]
MNNAVFQPKNKSPASCRGIIIIIIDSMTSVFNTDASLPYNHDLFESLINCGLSRSMQNVKKSADAQFLKTENNDHIDGKDE